MPHPVPTPRCSARLVVATALVLAGCTTTTAGTGGPARNPSGATSAGPLDELLGELLLETALGDNLVTADLAALPSGGAVGLVRAGGSEEADHVVELLPGASGPALGEDREVPEVSPFANVLVAADGTVVIADSGGARGEEHEYHLTVLAPGSTVPDERPLSDPPESIASGPAELSADGRTVYASLLFSDGSERNRLVTIDVETGEVLTAEDVGLGVPPYSGARSLVVRPDGGVSAAVLISPSAEDPQRAFPVLARFDDDLQLVGEPVDLLPSGEVGRVRGLALMSDGAVLVSLTGGPRGEIGARMLVVRDDEVERTIDLPGIDDAPTWFALDPDERYLYMAYAGPDGTVTVGTLDLAGGDVVAEVPLCEGYDPEILPPLLALDADAAAVTVVTTCLDDNREERAFRVG